MADSYKEFDKNPIVDTSDVIIKGFRFRKREMALGVAVLVCLLVIIILAALLGATNANNSGLSNPCQGECFSPPCLKTAAYVTELVNGSSAKPCEDFHEFACGNFPSLHPLAPQVNELSTFQLIHNKNMDRLRRLMEGKQDPKLAAPYHYETKLRTFFTSCTDHFDKMQQQGRPFLNHVVQPAGGWWVLQGDSQWDNATYDFQTQLQKVHVDFWTDAFFTFGIITDWLDWNKKAIQIDLSGIGVPYTYFHDDYFSQDLDNYKKFIRTVSSLLLRDSGLNITEQEKQYRVDTFVNDVFYVERELAMMKLYAKRTSNAHALDKRMKLSDLNAVSSNALDWVRLFTYMFDHAPVTADTYVVVLEQDYVKNFTAWLSNMDATNKSRILNNYLIWRVADRYEQDMSWDYIHANRQFYVDLHGGPNFLGAWRYCMYKVDRDMKEALGALFVKNHFNDENKRTAHDITKYVKRALVDSLKNSKWFSPATKKAAITKIQDSLIKLGYPDYMMNENTLNQVYSQLQITNDYFKNLMAFNVFFKDSWNKLLASQNDRTVWTYATYDFVASYYNPWKELLIPAGLLQFPIFDHSSPRYMNYGSMGSIVGKQLTHAIDEIGSAYMLNGSHRGNWWSNETTTKYQNVRKCVINAFQNATLGPFLTRSGPKKIPVVMQYYAPFALAISSGVKLAYMAYHDWMGVTGQEKSMPGRLYTNDQMFFISFAQTYCTNIRPTIALERTYDGYVPPEKFRVNAALSHLPEFQKAFNCPASSNMVAPKQCGLY